MIQIDTSAIGVAVEALAELAPEIQDAIAEGLSELAQRLCDEIAAIAPGRLGTEIRVAQLGEFDYEVGYDDPETEQIAMFVNYGTSSHYITPAFAKVLHFITPEGEEVFAREVMHPGIAPQYFLERAQMAIEAEAETVMEDKLMQVPDVEA